MFVKISTLSSLFFFFTLQNSMFSRVWVTYTFYYTYTDIYQGDAKSSYRLCLVNVTITYDLVEPILYSYY